MHDRDIVREHNHSVDAIRNGVALRKIKSNPDACVRKKGRGKG